MEILLKENERIDDLERNGYRIIQNKGKFCFGMDAVLLSFFVCEGEKKPSRIIDLGTGTGIIPLLIHGRLFAGASVKSAKKEEPPCIIGLEIQEDMQEMAKRSVLLNGLEKEISIVRGDIKDASKIFGKACFDVVVSNPPYMKQGKGLSNPDLSKAISRHEVMCSFEELTDEVAALLAPHGRFYLVHRPERLAELMDTLRHKRLEPKRLRLVHSFSDSGAVLVLIEAVKGAGENLKVAPPLIIYKEKGSYTDELKGLYSF